MRLFLLHEFKKKIEIVSVTLLGVINVCLFTKCI